jgi:hypothetical protein
MRSRDLRTSALHDVDMAGTPIHIHAGQVGIANPVLLFGVDTASGPEVTVGMSVGSAVLALAPYVLSGAASILDASSSQAGRLDP